MPTILERLRDGLAREYHVERELASGGMGSVFLAHDLTLDRPVAIKILRPELATAAMAARFVHEARVLASLRHSHIVPVHRAGEVDGFYYYVMDYIDGETLKRRLARGRLSVDETVKLGRDLLDALEAAHLLGIVHRDVKPANIFLVASRALLADFGIARSPTRSDEALTGPGVVVGTPGYMPLEQAAGHPVTPQTDICAVGMVLYEALCRRIWIWPNTDEPVDWSGVPRSLLPVLRRALAVDPAERWPDARSFRRALWHTRTRRYARRTVWLTTGGVVVGAVIAWLFGRGPPISSAAPPSIRVERFEVQSPEAPPGMGDSVAVWLARSLAGHPDFVVWGPERGSPLFGQTKTVFTGRIRSTSDGMEAEVREEGATPKTVAVVRVPSGAWQPLIDSLAYRILLTLWDEDSPLAGELPVRALPRSAAGLATWLAAERLMAQARWSQAYAGYLRAEAMDSTCWLCSWRLAEVERWLGLPNDHRRTARYLARLDSFPPHYQRLIRAGTVGPPARFDSLHAAAHQARGFYLGWMLWGDELFHRGPLSGHLRRESVEGFQAAVRLRRQFAPAWEHLAWVLIAEGDSAGAWEALDQYRRAAGLGDPLGVAIAALLQTGFAWRFLSPEAAGQVVGEVLNDPAIAGFKDLAAGPRLSPTFEAPAGSVALGRAFEAMRRRPDLVRSGLIAQVFGHVALGQLHAARQAAARLRQRFPEDDGLALFPTELEVALGLAIGRIDSARARPVLERFATRGSEAGGVRRRAATMIALLDASEAPDAERPRTASLPGAPGLLIEGMWLARSNRADRALDLTAPLLGLDSAGQAGDPALRSLLHLLRADWFERTNDIEGARRTLRWHEALDVAPGYPTGAPQAAEFDWALATAARWRRAHLLLRAGFRDDEMCAAFRAVARNWAAGDSVFVVKADSARRALKNVECDRVETA